MKAALSSLPAKPGVVIAIGLVIAVTAIYYFNNYRICSGHAEQRARFLTAVVQAADGATILTLSDITSFEWTEVSIVTDIELQGRKIECPLGWDWSWDERLAMVRARELAILVFSTTGLVVDFLDVRRDSADFSEMPALYTPDTARFTVTRVAGDNELFELTAIAD
jgi:hypothetical protein